MEELFRFSVIRPATRSNAPTVSLERPPATTPPATAPMNPVATIRPVISSTLPGIIGARANLGSSFATPSPTPPKSFQEQLRDVVQSLSPDHPPPEIIWEKIEPIAINFVLDKAYDILTNNLWIDLGDFLDVLKNLTPDTLQPSKWPISQWPKNVTEIARHARDPNLFVDYLIDLGDLFIALLIIRRGGPSNLDKLIRHHTPPLWDYTELLSDNPTLQEIASRINVIDLLRKPDTLAIPPGTAPNDIPAVIEDAFQAAMSRTLLFPSGIFGPFEKPVHGVGFREYHVVKQHIRRYELAEIGRIENILKGESRDHSQKHTLSNERDTFLQTETTTETDKELTSTDHVDIKNETQNQLKVDTKVDAGVHAQYSGPSFKLNADLTVSYDRATDDTKKYSSDVAKDVTNKAVTKVTQRVTQSQTTKIIETFEDAENQAFDNKNGTGHVSGVYQWVEKVYLAQVFNLGRHMLLDIMVPEPGATLLTLATTQPPDQPMPVAPDPLNIGPLDLSETPSVDPHDLTFYGIWVAKYGATGVEPPPPETITVVKSYSSDVRNAHMNDAVNIDDGYAAYTVSMSVAWRTTSDDENNAQIDILAGTGTKVQSFGKKLNRPSMGNFTPQNFTDFQRDVPLAPDPSGNPQPSEKRSIAVSLDSSFLEELSANIEITCKRTPTSFAKWQLQTYDKIATAWQKLQTAYESKLVAMQSQKANLGPLGKADPEANRLTERIELKRACIAIMDNDNAMVRGTNTPVQDVTSALLTLPEPILDKAQEQGSWVRWFEQAFEWENISYVPYPSFWGRRAKWVQLFNLKNEDPLLLNFLQAGYARVLVPVRIGFEWAVHFYLHTGLPWLGGGLPPIGDKTQNPLYLDIAEEIKALTGGGEDKETETPIGDPWEYILPTTLIKLRKDDALPEWHRVGLDGKENEKSYPSDQPGGPWLWKDGAPIIKP